MTKDYFYKKISNNIYFNYKTNNNELNLILPRKTILIKEKNYLEVF